MFVLGRLFVEECDCQECEQGICYLDSDLWLDGQDGEIDVLFVFVCVVGSVVDVVMVEVCYVVWGELYCVLLLLCQCGDGCWGVDDMIIQCGSCLCD